MSTIRLLLFNNDPLFYLALKGDCMLRNIVASMTSQLRHAGTLFRSMHCASDGRNRGPRNVASTGNEVWFLQDWTWCCVAWIRKEGDLAHVKRIEFKPGQVCATRVATIEPNRTALTCYNPTAAASRSVIEFKNT